MFCFYGFFIFVVYKLRLWVFLIGGDRYGFRVLGNRYCLKKECVNLGDCLVWEIKFREV